jgi:hypothetical protein
MADAATPPKTPKVGQAPKRTLGVNVRLRPCELAEAHRRAAGRSLGAIARAAWLGLPVPKELPSQPRSTLTAYESRRLQLVAMWGGLLDQCAAALNTIAKGGGRPGELMQVRLRLVALERQMDADSAVAPLFEPTSADDYEI